MTHDDLVTAVLTPLWRGLDADYKRKYARTIWQQFEDALRSAAYTSSLAQWYETLHRKLAIRVRSDDQAGIAAVIGSGHDRLVLRMIRDETSYLVVLVRVANDERNADARATMVVPVQEGF
jgi:hypothetical protein